MNQICLKSISGNKRYIIKLLKHLFKFLYFYKGIKIKKIIDEIEQNLPVDLLKIICDFHHCKKCLMEDKIKCKVCNIENIVM